MSAKVLVTGANGFLGSWLTRALIEAGHETYALVRRNSDLSELDGADCQYLYGDITDPESLGPAFKGMDTVFHLAGLVAYKKSDRALMEKVNVQGTQNVIQAIQTAGVRRMVHLSSVVAVGAGFNKNQILNEESKYNLRHLDLGYFETKRKAEDLVISACKSQQLEAVMLNPSTIYGAGDAKKGSRKTQIKVARGEFPFYTKGGVNVVAVEDVISGILAAWKKGRNGERYILAGDNLTIKELFEVIAQCAGVRPPQHLLPTPVLHALGFLGDSMNSLGLKGPLSRENAWSATLFHWFDSSKAQRELDFNPRKSQIAIANSVAWMRDNGYLSKP